MAQTKKRLLVLVDWFTPGYKAGGPIQSCVNLSYALRDEYDIYVLTTDTDHGEKTPYPGIETGAWLNNVIEGIHVCYLRKSSLSVWNMKKAIIAARADIVYLNHLFSPYFVVYPLILKLLGIIKSKVVLCPRGALYDSALTVKSFKKKPFISLFRLLRVNKKITFHATNEREAEAIRLFFQGSSVIIADNLPNCNQPSYQALTKSAGVLKCIFIARIVAIKNLLFFLEVLNDGIKGNIELKIVGPVEDEVYWNNCLQKMNELPSNIKTDYLGPKKNSELIQLLRENHLFILPTTGENFGHSIFEALLAGRPVLISDQTPWLKLNEKNIGWDLPLQSPGLFKDALNEAVKWNQDNFDTHTMAAWDFANRFINNPDLKKQYTVLFS